MADFDLNLSTRPFPAYRAINVALAIVLVFLTVVTAWQAYGFVRYSRMAQSIRADEQDVRVEAESLNSHVAELEARLDRPEATAKLNEIGFINGLIARKELSWTRLFASLEDMFSEDLGRVVHLVGLTPTFGPDGVIVLNISVKGRSIQDVVQFVKQLEQSPVFGKVEVSAEQKQDLVGGNADVDFTLTTNYYPQREIR